MNRCKLFVIVLVFSAPVAVAQAPYTNSSSLSGLTTPHVLAKPIACGKLVAPSNMKLGSASTIVSQGIPRRGFSI